ncbi:MAG: helix-turn-helix domain-containing protein [Patescibacteria group bacterium]
MYQEILADLGLSPNEAKIYESLIDRGESSISEIAIAANIHRRNAYDAINRLIRKGLCFQIFSATENRYSAVDPDKLGELSAEIQQRLQEILPILKKKFQERNVLEEAYIYRGLEGQKNIWRDILRVREESYYIGAKASWFDPCLEANRIAFFKEAKRTKIKFIQLFDNEVKTTLPNFFEKFPGHLEYRFLPPEYSTDSAIQVFGDYVITNTGLGIKKINEHAVFFVIHSKGLAESYRKWFWYMWEQSGDGKHRRIRR